MKKIPGFFLVWLMLFSTGWAQFNDESLNCSIKLSSEDGTQTLTLNNTVGADRLIEGYILQSRYSGVFEGRMKKGGFSFLDPHIFGGNISFLQKKWVDNNFPVRDLEVFTDGLNVSKVFSFQIMPVLKNPEADSLSLFFKYSVLVMREEKNKTHNVDDLNPEFDVHLAYKLVSVPFNKSVSFDFTDGIFKGAVLKFLFTKIADDSNPLVLPDRNNLIGLIAQSARESRLNAADFKFGIEFLRTSVDDFRPVFFTPSEKFLLRAQEYDMGKYTSVKNGRSGEITKLVLPVYYSHLSFPFKIYNEKKAEAYSKYKTAGKYLNSDYDIVVVPIEFKGDSLFADVFIDYSKLSIDDVQRWTPIKKRVKLIMNYGVSLDMPKENWSAVFERDGGKYEIYGYSDFEKFINEYLYINFRELIEKQGE